MPVAFFPKNVFRKLPQAVAVAVSGGPDSMALLHMLAFSKDRPKKIYALTVDHGLRQDSAAEARHVAAWVQDWPGVTHHILTWTGKKPQNAVQEKAREKRYALMTEFCSAHKIRGLFLAHHQTDQAETFLFRLAKGSGVDGLAAMAEHTAYRDTNIILLRPLLGMSKNALEEYCQAKNIPFVQDPSNRNENFARIRLRQALPMLEAEGLSEKRLAVTARRMQRARDALEFYTGKILRQAEMTPSKAILKMATLRNAPEDIRLRVIRHALVQLGADDYGPRLERLENLLADFFDQGVQAKPFTLGGFIFRLHHKAGTLVIMPESSPTKTRTRLRNHE